MNNYNIKEFYSQADPRWSNTILGTGSDNIKRSGCFLSCYAMLVNKTPQEVNQIFINSGVFVQNDLIDSVKACEVLNLNRKGRKDKPHPTKASIACVDIGYTHFVIALPDGNIIDPGKLHPVIEPMHYEVKNYRWITIKEKVQDIIKVPKKTTEDIVYELLLKDDWKEVLISKIN